MKQVVQDVYQIVISGFVAVYLIVREEGITLVDTGVPGSLLPVLDKELPTIGRQISDITQILITHAHFDHTGSLAALQARIPQGSTAIGRRDALYARGEQIIPYAPRRDLRGGAWLMSFMLAGAADPARIDRELSEGDEALPGWQVIELPGHSPGQVGYWRAADRLLIGGDVMGNFPLIGLGMPLRAPSPDWAAAKQSVRKVADLGVAVLCLGHIAPVYQADARIKALAAAQGV